MQPQAGRAEKRRAGTCAWHPQERAVLDCARCGAAMCPDCVQTIRGRDLCVDCAHAWRRSRLMAAGVSLMLFVALGLVGVIVLMSTFRTEKHQDQLAITERQVAADPENDVLRMQYVSLLSTAERWEEAISELGRVIQRNPKNQLLYERMVRLCMRARRFEEGAPNQVGIQGMGASLTLLNEIGIDVVAERVRANCHVLEEGMQDMGWTLISPRDEQHASGIVVFEHPEKSPEAIVQALSRESILCSTRRGFLRMAPHFYQSTDEMRRVVGEVAKL
ncbi:MAG: hypothetical protein CVU65_08315 [Deltaproteobacteria bacterium HGW-Deltaproteobacteria-22]|nr:MAG: hypothetical protein CVU65_08315 [Deltaproteobacteria bacterium HGW-Deltaproteobacteria-22]